MKNEKVLVIGASGTVGSELTRILRQEGHSVRTTTSKVASGPDSVHVDLTTGEGLREAFEGDFDRLIPKPTPQGLPQKLQQTLDLFGD